MTQRPASTWLVHKNRPNHLWWRQKTKMIQHQEPVWLLQVNYMLSNQQQKENSPKTTDSWSDRFTSEGRVASTRHVSALECVMQLVRRVTGNVWENINWVKITKQSDGVIDFFYFCPMFSASVLGKLFETAARCLKHIFPHLILTCFCSKVDKNQWCLWSSVKKKKKKNPTLLLPAGFYFCISHLHPPPPSPSSCTNIYRWASRLNKQGLIINL